MGHLKEKYTKEYFLKKDKFGKDSKIGVSGIEFFKEGKIRRSDEDILSRVDFRDKNVLEIGFGRGEAIKFIKDAGAKSVTGVDFSKESLAIAKKFIRKHKIEANLVCDDALKFVKNFKFGNDRKSEEFDIVVMLDFVEHIPRSELEQLLISLKYLTKKKSILVVNTPIFAADNDVIRDGLKKEALDESDEYEETRGMHCNKYTFQSLVLFMLAHGYSAVSGHFFARDFSLNISKVGSRMLWKKALSLGFPLKEGWARDAYEYAFNSENRPGLLTSYFDDKRSKFSGDYDLGFLKRVEFGSFSMFMTERFEKYYFPGEFEQFTVDLFESFIEDDSVILDIGSHYGFYSLVAGTKSGNASVHAFEPVDENKRILDKNVEVNNLNNIVSHKVGISSKKGQKKFHISEASDSSGFSVNGLAKTLREVEIKTSTVDDFVRESELERVDIVKMDTEGHESSVLDGMMEVIRKNDDIKIFIEFNPECLRVAGTDPEFFLKKLFELNLDIFFLDDKKRRVVKSHRDFSNLNEVLVNKEYINILCVKRKSVPYVSFFANSSQKGGASKSLLDIADGLIKKGALVNFVIPDDGPIIHEILERPISCSQTSIVPWTKGHGARRIIVKKVALLVQDNVNYMDFINPDLIYTNTSVINIGAIVSRILNKPHIWHIHEFGTPEHGVESVLGIKERSNYINKNAEKVFFVSDALRRYYKGVDKAKAELVYNFLEEGVEDFRRSGGVMSYYSKPKSLKLLLMGSIQPGKGQKYAVLALREVLRKTKDVELIIAGSSKKCYLTELEEIISENTLNENVKIIDYVDDYLGIISEADIVLMCSENEGFGRITAEAMFMHKPVIGARSGATPELVFNGRNGFLYEFSDHKELSNKILHFIHHKKDINKMGDCGYDMISKVIRRDELIDSIFKTIEDLVWKKRKRESFSVEEVVKGAMISDKKKVAALRKFKPIVNMKNKTSKNKIAVYTAIFGDYDDLQIPEKQNKDCDFFCFTDNENLKSDFWKIVLLKKEHQDSFKCARKCKLLSHKYLPDYDYTLWIDSNIKIETDKLSELLSVYLKDYDIAIHSHSLRDCVYDEATECIALGKDDPYVINKQIVRYFNEGYPTNNGLVETGILFRRHSGGIINLNERWWEELKSNSKRDQLSLNYVLWRFGSKGYYSIGNNIRKSKYFSIFQHKKKKLFYGNYENIATGDLQRECESLRSEVRLVKSSKFWKFRNIYIKTKKVILGK